MRRICLLLALAALPLIAHAADYNDSPLLIVGGQKVAETSAVVQATPITSATAQTAPVAAPTAPPPAALPQTPPLPPNFPETAVTNAAQNTAGNTNPVPESPAAPASPSAPAAGASLANPASPASPPTPESPVSKLWPRDTVQIFLPSCVGFHVELIPACTCVITTLMATMPHDEFLKLSADNTVESDPRLIRARTNCVATPGRKE